MEIKLLNPSSLSNDIARMPFLDLTIVVAEGDKILTTQDIVKLGMTKTEAFNVATENTKKKYWSLESFAELLPVLLSVEIPPIDFDYGMSVLISESGACLMTFPEVMESVGEKFNDDFIIFPSSIHEVIVVPLRDIPDGEETKIDLTQMVREINTDKVPPEEQLSNSVYIYKRKDKAVHLFQGGDV